MTGLADSERNMKMARRWFTEGWAGNISLAEDIFSASVRTNGVVVGVAGPKRRIQERLAAFPDLSVDIEDMFSAHDKIVARLVWRGTHTGSYAGIKATGKRVQVPDLPSGVSKTAKWLKYQRYRISSLCQSRLDIFPATSTRRSHPRRPDLPGTAWLPRTCTGRRGPAPGRTRGSVAPWRGGCLLLAAAGSNEMCISFSAERIRLTWEDPGIRLSEMKAGARASRLTRNVADGRRRR
jgi:hypothetical protein